MHNIETENIVAMFSIKSMKLRFILVNIFSFDRKVKKYVGSIQGTSQKEKEGGKLHQPLNMRPPTPKNL